MTYDHVRFWHFALFAATRHFVRYWTKADKVSFWLAEVCPLMTQSGHRWPFRCVRFCRYDALFFSVGERE